MRRMIGGSTFTPAPGGAVVTIGNFDGVHLGHQALLKKAVSLARAAGRPSAALTFWPHPLKVLSPERPLALLTPFERKMSLIERTGIDLLYCAEFDQAFSRQPPEEFVRSYLVEKIGCRAVIVGDHFAFGKDRAGKAEDLIRLGERYGFSVRIQEPVEVDGLRVSSSAIRSLLSKGKVASASRLLGRFYSLEGEVIRGEGRGRLLGFPTANVRPPVEQMLPLAGVYAGWVNGPESPESESPLPAAIYIGARPTFGEGEVLIEAHLLRPIDSAEPLHGKRLSVSLCDFIREDERFDDAAALARQIALDVWKIRSVLHLREC